METLSYLRGREREIEIGEEYYLGQLWDGSGDVEDIIEEDGQGCVWVGDDEDGTPVDRRIYLRGTGSRGAAGYGCNRDRYLLIR